MNRLGLVCVTLFFVGLLGMDKVAAAQCPYDVVGITISSPGWQFLPDGNMTFDFANPAWWEDDVHACYKTYQYPTLYYSYFSGCDLDQDGTVAIEEVVEMYYYMVEQSPPGVFSLPCSPSEHPMSPASVTAVSFGGIGAHTVRDDMTNAGYWAPHWELGQEGEPVAYVRGTSPAISVSIAADDAAMLAGTGVMIRGDGPGDVDIPPTWATVAGDTARLDAVYTTGQLPDTIYTFEPFVIDWSIYIEATDTWVDAGSSQNGLFVLHDHPLQPLWETTVAIGCRQAQGLTNFDDIVMAVWEEFTDRRVYRAWDDHLLSYYPTGSDPSNMPTSTAQVLSLGYGNCVGYGNFFKSITDGLGVPGVIYTDIRPYPMGGDQSPLLLAKNWDLSLYLADPQNALPYNTEMGIPGMGNDNPGTKLFVNHILVRYNGKILDTSYGIMFDSLLDWQRTILEAVMYDCSWASHGHCFDINAGDSWPLLVYYY